MKSVESGGENELHEYFIILVYVFFFFKKAVDGFMYSGQMNALSRTIVELAVTKNTAQGKWMFKIEETIEQNVKKMDKYDAVDTNKLLNR